MRFRRPPETPEASFDLTPMIDIVLLLIIFFTMTAHFARTTSTPVELPRQPGETATAAGENQIVIDINTTGSYVLLGRVLPLMDLANEVKAEVDRGGGAPDVLIRADRTCKSAHLNRLATALAAAGVRQWKLATAGPDPAKPAGGAS